MTIDDLKNLESYLGLTLPTAYAHALLTGVTIPGAEPGLYFQQDAKSLLIANLELRMAVRKDTFCGTPWPPQMISIGDDGCGQTYCISADDPSCAVQCLEEEPETVVPDLPAFFEYISNLFGGAPVIMGRAPIVEILDPAIEEPTKVFIARTTNPRESVLDPISLDEWTAYVDVDPELQMQSYRIVINPFTFQQSQLPCPGLAVLGSDPTQQFHYDLGRIEASRPGPEVMEKRRQTAVSLKARFLAG